MPDVDAARTADMAWTRLRDDPYAPLRDIGAESLARNMGPSNAASHIADGYLLLWMEQGLGPDPTISGYSADQTGLAVAEAASRVRGSDAYAAARGFDVFSVIAAAARSVASIAADLLVGSDAGADEHAEVASGIGVKLSLLEWTAIAVIVLDGVLGEDNVPALLGLVATDRLRRARREFMSTGILGVADILLYQRNGGDIRRFVADELHRARVEETGLQQAGTSKGRVVALGNSLGGIILADTLAESARSDCDVFVTMGSQPGALRVLGALGEAASHGPFQPWLNIYDPRDFMAFKAVGIWHGATQIEDIEIDLGARLPAQPREVVLRGRLRRHPDDDRTPGQARPGLTRHASMTLAGAAAPSQGTQATGPRPTMSFVRKRAPQRPPVTAHGRSDAVYGTIARLRALPGSAEKLLSLNEGYEGLEVPGFVATYVYRSDSESGRVLDGGRVRRPRDLPTQCRRPRPGCPLSRAAGPPGDRSRVA